MATNGRKRYFHIDKNAGSEQIYTLLVYIYIYITIYIFIILYTDNLINDSGTEFIAEE